MKKAAGKRQLSSFIQVWLKRLLFYFCASQKATS